MDDRIEDTSTLGLEDKKGTRIEAEKATSTEKGTTSHNAKKEEEREIR